MIVDEADERDGGHFWGTIAMSPSQSAVQGHVVDDDFTLHVAHRSLMNYSPPKRKKTQFTVLWYLAGCG